MFRGLRGLRVRILLLPVSPRIDRPALGRGRLLPHVLRLVAPATDPTARVVLQRERVQKGVVSRGRQRAASVPVVLALLLLLTVPSESGGERSTSGGGVHAARDRGTSATAGHRRAGAGGASRLPIDETTREDARRRRARAARTRTRRQRLFDSQRTATYVRLRRDVRVAVPIHLSNKTKFVPLAVDSIRPCRDARRRRADSAREPIAARAIPRRFGASPCVERSTTTAPRTRSSDTDRLDYFSSTRRRRPETRARRARRRRRRRRRR